MSSQWTKRMRERDREWERRKIKRVKESKRFVQIYYLWNDQRIIHQSKTEITRLVHTTNRCGQCKGWKGEREKKTFSNGQRCTQIPQILHEIIVGSSWNDNCTPGTLSRTFDSDSVFTMQFVATRIVLLPFGWLDFVVVNLWTQQNWDMLLFLVSSSSPSSLHIQLTTQQHCVFRWMYIFAQITHLLTSKTLNHYNIVQFNG